MICFAGTLLQSGAAACAAPAATNAMPIAIASPLLMLPIVVLLSVSIVSVRGRQPSSASVMPCGFVCAMPLWQSMHV